jgi:Holliday junction resolvase RusA-like endonuclease
MDNQRRETCENGQAEQDRFTKPILCKVSADGCCLITFHVSPCPKPRQSRSDKWRVRPEVLRYRVFCDSLRLQAYNQKFQLPDSFAVEFILPMPKSWSQKKKKEMNGKPHRQTADIDNLLKALIDALLSEDKQVWDVHASKRWGEIGQIRIYTPTEFDWAD